MGNSDTRSQLTETIKKRDAILAKIGNIVHDSVPVSNNEDNNLVIRTWGPSKTYETMKHHHELLFMIDGFDAPRGSSVVGHRGYFLKGNGQRLSLAITNYATQFLVKKGYTLLQPPLFMNKDVMSKTAQLEQFDEELYKVESQEGDKYLIATSEQPISAFHQNENLEPDCLPLKYGGFSACFRKEAGSAGRDVWGIFRVHQFDKIEQFVITEPDKSWEMHETMCKVAEEFLQSLNLPYQVISIVSGALNNAAAKKYDIEGWFPGYHADKKAPTGYRELVSCSNCTDYQSYNLNIHVGETAEYVHMLNATLCAVTRIICAILENYQTPTGIKIPDVLIPYMGNETFIPFVKNELPLSKGSKH